MAAQVTTFNIEIWYLLKLSATLASLRMQIVLLNQRDSFFFFSQSKAVKRNLHMAENNNIKHYTKSYVVYNITIIIFII